MKLLLLKWIFFMTFCILFPTALAVGDISAAGEPSYQIKIDPSKTADVISPFLFAHNLENTRWAMYKGLSTQIPANRKFAGTSRIYNWKKIYYTRQKHDPMVLGRPDAKGVAAHWYPIGSGEKIWHRADTEIYFSAPQSQRIDLFANTKAGIGQSNIPIKVGVEYAIHFWLRAKKHISTTVRLTDASGENIYAKKKHKTSVGQWHKLSFTCTPAVTDPNARLEIIFQGPGMVWIDSASMMPSDNFHGMRRDVIELLKQMSVPLLRWPGGNFTRDYMWKEGLLDVDRRPAIMMHNHETLPFTDNYDFHEIGIDEFIRLCKYLDAEPSIVFNLNDSVQSAVDWVQYCNGSTDTKWGRIRAERGRPQPYNVKYFSIGNEIYGDWMGPANFGPAEYSEVLKRFTKAIKKADPSIIVTASGTRRKTGWNPKVISEAADYMDMYSAHYYGPTAGPEITYKVLMQGRSPTTYFRKSIEFVRGEINGATPQGYKIPVTFDEWNRGHKWMGDPYNHTWNDGPVEGMYLASALNMFCRQAGPLNISMCVFFQPVNEGCITVKPHTAFLNAGGQVFKLFKAHHGNRLLQLADTFQKGNDPLDVCASLSLDGKNLAVTLLNRKAQKDEVVELSVPDPYLIKNVSADILCTDDLQNPDALFKLYHRRPSVTTGRKIRLELPTYSITLIKAALDGNPSPTKCEKEKCYLFSYFKDSGASGVYLAYSYDGLRWTELNGGKPFIKATIGGAFTWGGTNDSMVTRDPCIIRGPDGTFHMVFTAYVKPLGFGYTNSKDLINWSEQKVVWVMANEPNAINCWAPDLFYDDVKKEYLILWSTTVPGKYPETDGQSNLGPPSPGKNHRIYYCTTKDFKTFSESKLFYNDGFNVIDASIVKDKNQYVMFLKDETNLPFVPQKNIRMAFSSRPQGPYSSASKPITGDYWCEGPAAIKIADNWYVYFDKYRKGSYGVVTSKDLKNWKDISESAVFPQSCNHGTPFKVPREILDKLLKLQ